MNPAAEETLDLLDGPLEPQWRKAGLTLVAWADRQGPNDKASRPAEVDKALRFFRALKESEYG